MDDNGISWDLTTMRIKLLTSNCPDPSPPSRFLREENNKLTLCSRVTFFILKLAEMYYIYIYIFLSIYICIYIYMYMCVCVLYVYMYRHMYYIMYFYSYI